MTFALVTTKLIAVSSLLAGALAVLPAPSLAREAPREVIAAMADATLAGSSRLKVLGFEVYDSRLWVAPGFRAATYAQHPLVLELHYLRDVKGSAIAERSIAEMQRVGSFGSEQAQRWQASMAALFPDIKKHDRLSGIYRPGEPLRIVHNGQLLGELADAAFAEIFIGIWLSPRTSEPKMRQALLARAPQ
jgi:hypothetical protein